MMDTDAGQMEEIWRELRDRYPLLERVVVHSLGEENTEALPLFFGLFLAALDDKEGAPCCFVLPRRGQMARLAAIVFGLSVFRREFNALAREYAEQKFTEGQRVRVHPSNRVFAFGGFWPNQPEKFRLCTLDGTGSRTFPANDVLRLEPTHLVTPRGRLDTRILEPETTPLDEVLGIPIFGNLSLFKNRVLCLDEQIRFTEFTGGHSVQKEGLEAVLNLAELLPFGWLREGATGNAPTFENWSTRYPRAEPLVAVTSSCERLATFCCGAQKRSKVVVVNGLRVLSSPQAFDDIASCQRLVLFADHDDEERMKDLEARGCRFWVFGEREFFSHGGDALQDKRGPFGSIVHRARNLARLQIQPEPCESEPLNAIALKLEELRPEVDAEAETNPNGRLGRLAQRLWRMLNEAAGLCCEPSAPERDRFSHDLAGLNAELESGAFWLKPEIVTKLRGILESFRELFEPGSRLGINKGEALRRAIVAGTSASASEVAVLTRTETQARVVETWLRSEGFKASVFSLATIPDDASFDRLIVTSWPGGDAFRRLVGKLITAEIVAVSYGFEARWLSQCQRRFSQRATLTPVSAIEKAALIGGGVAKIVWPEEKIEEPPPSPSSPPAATSTFDVWSYEQRLRSIRKGSRDDAATGATALAKYVSFIGASYAFLTQWHKVPVAIRLLGANQAGPKALPERAVDDLKPGDLVVFPEGGQKAVIAQMADRLIGTEAPAVRKRSRLWQETLRSSGLTPEQFLAHAKSLGYSRHIGTIRNWFYDEAQIGPGEREDLDLIAVVTDSPELGKAADDVWDAISFLRSNHLGAGSVLRDAVLQQLQEALAAIEENGSRIEVPNLGAAWVVQVDAIAPDFTDEPRNQVDRLLWDDR